MTESKEVPKRSKAMRVVGFVILAPVVLVLLALTTWVLWFLTAELGLWDKEVTVADVEYDGLGRFFIVEKRDSPLDWQITLYWERNQHFMAYYIAHESDYRDRMVISRSGARIIVTDNGSPIGELNTDDGSFFHIPRNELYDGPIRITIGGPRGSGGKTVYPETSSWKEVYDRAMGRSLTGDPEKPVLP